MVSMLNQQMTWAKQTIYVVIIMCLVRCLVFLQGTVLKFTA